MAKRNRIEILEDHALIHIDSITYGHIAIKVDLDCVDQIKDYCWGIVNVGRHHSKNQYARCKLLNPTPFMHQQILGVKPGSVTDHINRNTLDNRKCNLRTVSYSVNQCNRGKQKNSNSGYKGVYWQEQRHKWRAKIQLNGKTINLGSFNTPEEAAIAYNEGNIKYHGGVFQNDI